MRSHNFDTVYKQMN